MKRIDAAELIDDVDYPVHIHQQLCIIPVTHTQHDIYVGTVAGKVYLQRCAGRRFEQERKVRVRTVTGTEILQIERTLWNDGSVTYRNRTRAGITFDWNEWREGRH